MRSLTVMPIVSDMALVSRRYPFLGSARFWYRFDRWVLSHPSGYGLIGAVLAGLLPFIWNWPPATALALAPLAFLWIRWNASSGFMSERLERRVYQYEREDAPDLDRV